MWTLPISLFFVWYVFVSLAWISCWRNSLLADYLKPMTLMWRHCKEIAHPWKLICWPLWNHITIEIHRGLVTIHGNIDLSQHWLIAWRHQAIIEVLWPSHYSDVVMSVMASQITSVPIHQPFVRAQIKENIRAPRHWPLWGGFTGDSWIPCTKGQ